MRPVSDGSGDGWAALAAVAMLIVYLKVVWHRQGVAFVECCLAVGYLCIIFPSGTFSVYTQEAKIGIRTPTCVLHLILACLVSKAMAHHLTRNSSATEVAFCSTVASIFTYSSLSLCALHGIFNVQSVSNSSCLVTLAVLLPLVIGDLIHLFQISAKYGKTVGDPVSWHISVDAVASFLLGCLIIAFQGLLCAKLDEASGLVVKALGFMIVGQSIHTFGSLTYENEEDARSALKAKCLMYAVFTLATVASYYTDTAFWSNGHPLYIALVSVALAYNALCGMQENPPCHKFL